MVAGCVCLVGQCDLDLVKVSWLAHSVFSGSWKPSDCFLHELENPENEEG